MTKKDVQKIFNVNEIIIMPNRAKVSIYNFLHIAGFKDCEPKKEAMLDFDGGTKGYKELIENGNFEVTQ